MKFEKMGIRIWLLCLLGIKRTLEILNVGFPQKKVKDLRNKMVLSFWKPRQKQPLMWKKLSFRHLIKYSKTFFLDHMTSRMRHKVALEQEMNLALCRLLNNVRKQMEPKELVRQVYHYSVAQRRWVDAVCEYIHLQQILVL